MLSVLVKEELYDKVVKVRRVNDRVMSIDIVFEEEVVRVACALLHKVENRFKKNKMFMKNNHEKGPLLELNHYLAYEIKKNGCW